MISRIALSTLFLSALALTVHAEDSKHHPMDMSKNPRFERFKQLAGVWEGKETEGRPGQDVKVEYRVTSGGSTVVETFNPGTPMEMMTLIHRDGDDMLLTHYCMLGNQPRMKASGTGDANQFAFKFVGATNLKSPSDMYMHDVTYTLIDNDTLRSEWTHYQDGKDSGRVVFELKRKK
jgi:hypothetical protein